MNERGTMKYIFWMVMVAGILSFVACGHKQTPPGISWAGENEDWQQSSGKPNEILDPVGSDDHPVQPCEVDTQDVILKQVYAIWKYNPKVIYVPAHTTVESVMCDNFPQMRKCFDFKNVGGPKLIGEMAADKVGLNESSFPWSVDLSVLPLSKLHLGVVTSPNNVLCKVVDQKVEISKAEIVRTDRGMTLSIDISNRSDMNQEVEIAQGQMIEVDGLHVQNVVVLSRTMSQLRPNDSRHFMLPVYCAAHHRNSPTGFKSKITPYVMNATDRTFQSQQGVWDLLESDDDPNDYVTFYVWGKGDATGSGSRSKTGHAFVRIPQVGVWGFSSVQGNLLGDEGTIYDHAAKVRYATDSCRIKVSKQAKEAMAKKLRQLQQDVPRYRIGRYDCTSFVMDIADAGGIHYGSRITIQTPVGFMQELKKHNYAFSGR